MLPGPEHRSRDIGAGMTLALHLLLAFGLMIGVQMETTAAPPVKGKAMLQLRVHKAQASPPCQAAAPQPKPAPVPKPEPAPEPEPRPEPVAEPEPLAVAESPAEPSEGEVVDQAPAEGPADPSPSEGIGDPDAEKRAADLTDLVVAALRARIESVKRYPFAARKAGITGTVRILVEIDEIGRVAGYRMADPAQAHQKLLAGADQTMQHLVGVRLGEVELPSPLLVEVPIVYELH